MNDLILKFMELGKQFDYEIKVTPASRSTTTLSIKDNTGVLDIVCSIKYSNEQGMVFTIANSSITYYELAGFLNLINLASHDKEFEQTPVTAVISANILFNKNSVFRPFKSVIQGFSHENQVNNVIGRDVRLRFGRENPVINLEEVHDNDNENRAREEEEENF